MQRMLKTHTAGISLTEIHAPELVVSPFNFVVAFFSQVGPSYGRKMMTGFLASKGFKVSQQRVGVSLRRVNPFHHSRRQNTSFNPIPYTAAYFGEKLHSDQNEKLIMYGVTHVCAVDGFSDKIVGFIPCR